MLSPYAQAHLPCGSPALTQKMSPALRPIITVLSQGMPEELARNVTACAGVKVFVVEASMKAEVAPG